MEGKNLVIVESPGKCDTIRKALGEGYTVKASIGHIRDLQEKKLSVDIQHGFAPEYVVPSGKARIVSDLKRLAAQADTIWLASDEDREGEAIAWHLFETLGLQKEKTRRIAFHEITKNAILEAIQHPRDIDMNLVGAQQARRVLDRLVGFELSPILWRKIQPKLSAGRVQSVALRLIVDREKEIMAFKSEPYYKVEASFVPEGSRTKVKATLDSRFSSLEEARKFLEDSIGARYAIESMEKKEAPRMPAAPFTTSTLQQEAGRKLHFPVATTMRVAQSLYERGLITYMRTDSTNLSALAVGSAKRFILDNFGEDYSRPRQYKTRTKGAQEAHEAIRPTYIDNTSIEGSAQEKKLYELIWKRTIASQMSEARVVSTAIKVASDKRSEKYSILAAQVLFDGFLKVYMEGKDDGDALDNEVILPDLSVGSSLLEKGVSAECKFTAAPPRYSEPTLVRRLEELEIGRPSTYATIITTLTTGRGYVVKGDKEGRKVEVTNLTLKDGSIIPAKKIETVGAEKGKLLPQEIGIIVTDYLVNNFGEVLGYDFTARVEEDFDEIAKGEKVWNTAISEFYTPFHKQVESVLAVREYSHVEREIGTDPATGDKLVARFGQYGPYVQKGDGDNRQYASLGKGQLIETLTLADALKLFELPRTVGQLDGVDVVAMKGRFGPYIKYGDRNVSLPRGTDPLKVSIEECAALLAADADKKAAPAFIAEFAASGIQIVNGRYGPYIKQGASNYKIPRGVDASTLTEADCQNIIAGAEPTGKAKKRYRK
jgi:DNA topoisomerase-1